MSRIILLAFVGLAVLVQSNSVNAQQVASSQELFEFDTAKSVSDWNIVNDGVMGGRSTSSASFAEESFMRFSGTLSLENNGGFASVRSKPASGSLGLESDSTIVIRVNGDGRKYTFNFYTPDRRMAYSFQKDFQTKKDQWQEIRLPVSEFVAHSFGRRLSQVELDAKRVHSVGILLGDKQAGGFEILIDWIRAE